MTTTRPAPSEIDHESRLQTLAEKLYGPEWAPGVARLTGIALRTIQRTRASILAGERDLRASGILRAMKDSLNMALVEGDQRANAVGELFEGRGHFDRVNEWRYLVSPAMAYLNAEPGEVLPPVGPFTIETFSAVILEAQAFEQGLRALLSASVALEAGVPSGRRMLTDAIERVTETLEAIVAEDPDTEDLVMVALPSHPRFGSGYAEPSDFRVHEYATPQGCSLFCATAATRSDASALAARLKASGLAWRTLGEFQLVFNSPTIISEPYDPSRWHVFAQVSYSDVARFDAYWGETVTDGLSGRWHRLLEDVELAADWL